MHTAYAVVAGIPSIIDVRNNNEWTALLVTNTAGKTFLVDVQPVNTAGWKKSTEPPFQATHPLYLNRR